MKKITILLTFLILIMAFQTQSTGNDLTKFHSKVKNGKLVHPYQSIEENALKGVLTQKWKSNNWEDVRRFIYTYNEIGLPITMNFDSLHLGNWVTLSLSEIEYNSGNQMAKATTTFTDVDGNIEMKSMSEYSYSGNNIDEVIRSTWDESAQVWKLAFKEVYEYSGELITKTTDYQWDETSSDWIIFLETTYTYDNEGREIESISKIWDESEGQYINSNKTTTEYYEGMKISRQESKSWDFVNEQWSDDNYSLLEYQYDSNGNLIEYIYTNAFGFGGFSIFDKSRSTYEYDSNNYLVLEKNYDFDEVSQVWVETGKVEYTNDASGMVQYDIEYIYDGTNYLEYEKNIYSYEGIVDVENTSNILDEFVLHQNYPNPFNPSTIISFSVPKTSEVEIKIYDILGNDITTLIDERLAAGDYQITFDTSKMHNLTSGIYIIYLMTNDFSLSKKCLLLK